VPSRATENKGCRRRHLIEKKQGLEDKTKEENLHTIRGERITIYPVGLGHHKVLRYF
ncbi:rCG40957, partial [Rattus norvegicus]